MKSASDPADLPRLWEQYAGISHNGGPALRPTISTPEMQDQILDAIGDGAPLSSICQGEGMPELVTVHRW